MPRPSAGTQSRRSNGFDPIAVARRKKSVMAPSEPVTHGIMSRRRERLSHTAAAAYMLRMSVQNSIDPDCPAQKAVKV